MSPRTSHSRSPAGIVWIVGSALITASMVALWLLSAAESWWVTPVQTSIAEPVQTGPKMEKALMSLSDAWREENRLRR